jgi:uncharacterized damage-inducible protein DinB
MGVLIEQHRAAARYNTWMNRRLYAACGKLDDEERRRDRGAFFGSIHGTLNHLLLADRTWMARFTGDVDRFASRDAGGTPIAVRSLRQELYGDFAQLTRERAATDAEIEAWIAGVEDAQLAEPFRYRNMAGAAQEHVLWWAVAHFFNHQTHHRGQITTLLHQAGIDPGVTDLVAFLRNPDLA